MRHLFNIKHLVSAISILSIASVASAAGLDRSGQPVTAFFQDGTYAETVYTYIDADVTGKDVQGNKIKDIAEDYDFFRYGVKTDINDAVSIGVLYDEPWGAAADYKGNNIFIAQGDLDASIKHISGGQLNSLTEALGTYQELQNKIQQSVAAGQTPPKELVDQATNVGAVLGAAQVEASTLGEETQVEVRSESLTGLLGLKLGQNKNFQIYGGPVAQRLKADVKLRGMGYESANGYNLNVNRNTDYGWIAGVQYSKPEIALKASLTYRSEIDHDVDAAEHMPLLARIGQEPSQVRDMEITTPESVNFDFQTGINPTTLATAKVRWVPWSDFAITPPLYNESTKRLYPEDGLNLVDYSDDQWLVELGLGKRLADNLAVSGTIGWDSGAGDPVSSLGPVEGYYSLGLGAKYNFNKNWALSAGGKYLWFGDAEGKIPNENRVSKFEDNDGYALGVQVSYQAK